ncbi:MAG: IS110 family transposase [Flavobacteriales bacterium]|nr:IS110 family transposase [Flavobacteriales bacterium]
MNKFTHFIGIDVSKEYFDVVFMKQKKESTHNQFINSNKGIKQFIKWIKTFDCTSENTLICLEHTGIYGNLITSHLHLKGFKVWIEMSLRIIKNSGVQRGKNDKIDAERIALYALKNQEEAVIFNPQKREIEKIKKLISLRERLVNYRASLKKIAKEFKDFDLELSKLTDKYQKNTLKGIEKDLQKIENQLDELIKTDEKLNTTFKNITSVSGVGKVTALLLICLTNEFQNFENPRQLACYAGVVPFEYSSGKSVKLKTRVHFMANKKLKKVLHMCALTASKNDPELHQYFERKVKEGKNKILVLNNIRNKIIHRICACVRDNRTYIKKEIA